MSESGRLAGPTARRRTVALAGHQGDEATARAALTDDDADPLAAAWSMSERGDAAPETDSVGAGMGMGRKGLFGR